MLLQFKANERSLTLRFVDESAAPELVMSDSVRLRQILLNVIGNAIKFTTHGGVTVTMRTETTDRGQLLGFEVHDTGIGLTEDQRGRIFHAFSQGDSSMTRRFGGTGLGLEISRRLARALGGDLTLENTAPGRGSTFLITICTDPQLNIIQKPEREPQPPTTSAPGHELERLRVLVVEDVQENQLLIGRLLERQGAVAIFAENGEVAIKAATEQAFDVILMDIQMPVMNGYDATRELRAKGLNTPIIALTAHALREDREACLAAGCTDYLTKPIKLGELIPTILRVTQRLPESVIPIATRLQRD